MKREHYFLFAFALCNNLNIQCAQSSGRSGFSKGSSRGNRKSVETKAPRPCPKQKVSISPFDTVQLEPIKLYVWADIVPPELRPNAPLESFLSYCAGDYIEKKAQVLRALIEYRQKKTIEFLENLN